MADDIRRIIKGVATSAIKEELAKMKEPSALLTKLLDDLKHRPSKVRGRWKKLSEDEMKFFHQVNRKNLKVYQAKFDKLIAKGQAKKNNP